MVVMVEETIPKGVDIVVEAEIERQCEDDEVSPERDSLYWRINLQW